MAVPCRIWKPWGAMKADVEVRVPALLPACESTHAGYIAALLISGKLVKNAEHHLGSQGGSFKVPADLAVEDQVELCLVPTFGPDQGKGHRICAPVLSSLVMLRGGTG